MSDIKEILESIGYTPSLCGKSYRCIPLYRQSDSPVLFVDKNTGLWYDFKEARGGELKELVRITTGKSYGEVDSILKNKNFSGDIPKEAHEEELGVKHFPKEWLAKLEKDHTYWTNRGVNHSTISTFEGGIARDGRMYYRYVFPIFGDRDNVIGFDGRDILNSNKRVKWKILGPKKTFCYPYNHFNKEILHDERKVILVESIGDMLRLWDNGIKNTLVIFGVYPSPKVLSTLIKIDPTEIIIATNNDKVKNGDAGNKAARRIKGTLHDFFDPDKVRVHLPEEANDFGDMTDQQITSWHEKLKNYQPQE